MTTTYQLATPTAKVRPIAAWRVAMAANAVVAAVALTIKFADAATTTDPRFTSVVGRVANELCYFTIESNIIVLAVCAGLAWRPDRLRWLVGTPRLAGLVCITVTGVVYYALLAGDEHFVGIAKVGDVLAHMISPILFVGTWLVLGPRGSLERSQIARMMSFPMAWVALTLVRGAIIHVYPYDFVDVGANGYVAVVVTIAALMSLAAAMAAGAVRLDRRRAANYSMVP